MLANGHAVPSLNSYFEGVTIADDGSADVYIGPEPPPSQEHTWTLPEPGWIPLPRIYGPLEP